MRGRQGGSRALLWAARGHSWAPLEGSHLAHPCGQLFPLLTFLLKESHWKRSRTAKSICVERETEDGPPKALSNGHVKA